MCVQEPLPKPDRVPQLDALFIPKPDDDDDDDLKRLAEGLKVDHITAFTVYPRALLVFLILIIRSKSGISGRKCF